MEVSSSLDSSLITTASLLKGATGAFLNKINILSNPFFCYARVKFFLMDPSLKIYLQSLKAYGLKNNIPNVSETVGQFLNLMIKIKKPQRILEIGSANGYSTLWMAQAARTINAQIYTMDHSEPTFKQLEINLAETGLGDVVIPHFGKALQVIADFPANIKFDFVFVDGEKASYLDFWKALEPRLADQPLVIFDDMIAFSQKTKVFSDYLKTLEAWDPLILPLDANDGVLVMIKR